MSRTKDANWPAEPRTPRPPSPVKSAFRAAWNEFWRVLEQRRKAHKFPNVPF